MSLYKDLGVPTDATDATIRKAYRKKAAKTHPDKGGDVASFQLIQRAYDILSDEEKRRRYDSQGTIDTPPDTRTIALQNLATLVLQAIENSHSIETDNILAVVKQSINNGILQGREQESQTSRRIAKFERALKRFTTKGDFNPIAAFVEQKIREQQANLEMTKNHIELGAVMMELIKDYSYQTDNQPKGATQTQTFFFQR